ncbi:MAG: DUF86 domain-containing protein [Anaerolineae bacterium]|nr:DUF86 domain-containing protein [Anaerolineae bacterium]
MSLSWIEYLRHILDEADYLEVQSRDLSIVDFLEDDTLQRAFVRSLEIIGEATKKLPDSVKQAYADVDWRAIAGMRDKLIHDYFGVDYEIVWDVVINRIPPLKVTVERMIATAVETNTGDGRIGTVE